jgi:hypothetical protein
MVLKAIDDKDTVLLRELTAQLPKGAHLKTLVDQALAECQRDPENSAQEAFELMVHEAIEKNNTALLQDLATQLPKESPLKALVDEALEANQMRMPEITPATPTPQEHERARKRTIPAERANPISTVPATDVQHPQAAAPELHAERSAVHAQQPAWYARHPLMTGMGIASIIGFLYWYKKAR